MAYCTVTEVLDSIKESVYDALLGDDYIEDVEERKRKLTPLAEQAIADADAEIDGYLTRRYSVPMDPAPRVLNKFSKDIAIYNLLSRIGIDEQDREKTWLNRYNAAVRFLESVAKGLIDLGTGKTQAQEAQNGFRTEHSVRLFSRESMRGW